MIRIGLLGASWIAPQAIIDPASVIADTCIDAVAARDATRARRYADTYGIRKSYGTYEELLADPELDTIYISLPPSLHAEPSIRALEAGKNVICEKPAAMNIKEAKAMVDAATSNGRRLVEAFHSRYHPAFETCRNWVRSGAIGPVTSMRAHFGVGIPDDGVKNQYRPELGGGSIMDMGCYPLHWVSQMAGTSITESEVTAVVAASGVDESMNAKLTFEGGATAEIWSSMHPETPFDAHLKIIGRDGHITFNNPLVPHQSGILSKTVNGETTNAAVSTVTTYCYQLQAIAAAFKSGSPLPTEGEGLLAQQANIDLLYEKAGLNHLRH